MLRPMQTNSQTTTQTTQPVFTPPTIQNAASYKEIFDMSFGSPEDVQELFREMSQFDDAFDRIQKAAMDIYEANKIEGVYPADHNMNDELEKIYATIGMPRGIVANLPITAGGTTTTYDVNNLNDLLMLPYMVSEEDLKLLTDKMLKAGFLDSGTMPFGIVNASDPTFTNAWKQLLRASITNGRGISAEITDRIDQRVNAAKEQLESQRPTEEANLQSVATSLLGRQLNGEELNQAMNFITSQFSYLPDEKRFLDTDSPLFDETVQQQTQFEALEDVAGGELQAVRKGGALLGLASFDPRRDYGLSAGERETFARLDVPDSPIDLMTGDNNE